ncbi:protein TPX2 isoform X2 [Amborella trichopoda]|uniref:protein TPX2 isoform X2 n=1 Tax=Amborella trichopoda TaxID=13333 RepID=UPI0009C1A7DD|nr:protein TPX2 isoform X2 [Amborella trichopoda]|eukprot:XP_020531479.1 protein TPX2 isoform X2 [Amborella trichopoda]
MDEGMSSVRDRMDEAMTDVDEGGGGEFLSLEIDLDYEYSAPHYFDFVGRETPSEAEEAELWFETVGSCPPAPYIARLPRLDEFLADNMNLNPQANCVENDNHNVPNSICEAVDDAELTLLEEKNEDLIIDAEERESPPHHTTYGTQTNVHFVQAWTSSSLDLDCNSCTIAGTFMGDSFCKGLVSHNPTSQDIPKISAKFLTQATRPKSSTLMRPTASQLAKQNRLVSKMSGEVKNSSRVMQRVQKPLLSKNEKVVEKITGNESQAPKRQKLDVGHLPKAHTLKEQTVLLHKAPTMGNDKHCTLGGGASIQSKLRLTIPREPELETAQRARRIMIKKNSDAGEGMLLMAPKFKARPLNRKIFEAPSVPLPQKSIPRVPEFREFHLKTTERAIQHAAAAPSLPSHVDSNNVANKHKHASSNQVGTIDLKMSCHQAPHLEKHKVVDEPKQEQRERIATFKARPLNPKILSSKGDIGMFKNCKREATKPTEFSFPTDKRFPHHKPPIDLFSKLSLRSEHQPNAASQTTGSQHYQLPFKACGGSKENVTNATRQEGKSLQEKMKFGRNGGKKDIQSQSKLYINQDHAASDQRFPFKEVHEQMVFGYQTDRETLPLEQRRAIFGQGR